MGHVDDFLSLYNGAVFVIGMVNVTLILYLLIWETGMFEVKLIFQITCYCVTSYFDLSSGVINGNKNEGDSLSVPHIKCPLQYFNSS